jgi:hypothetical protein
MSEQPVPPSKPVSPRSPEEQAEVENRNPFLKVLASLYRMRDEPRLLVLVTHGFIELLINAIADEKCRNASKITSNSRDFPHSAKLTILHEMRVLSDHHYRLLNWFRKLRNDSAHDPFFELTPSRLDLMANEKFREVKNLSVLCRLMLMDLWRSYDTIIGNVFMPDHYLTERRPVLMKSIKAKEHLIPLTNDPEWVDEEDYEIEFPQTEFSKHLDDWVAKIREEAQGG